MPEWPNKPKIRPPRIAPTTQFTRSPITPPGPSPRTTNWPFQVLQCYIEPDAGAWEIRRFLKQARPLHAGGLVTTVFPLAKCGRHRSSCRARRGPPGRLPQDWPAGPSLQPHDQSGSPSADYRSVDVRQARSTSQSSARSPSRTATSTGHDARLVDFHAVAT